MLDKILHMKIAESAWRDASIKECPGTSAWKVLYEQKLIEAVVRECQHAIEDLDHGSSDEWDRAIRVVSANVREHFGLE